MAESSATLDRTTTKTRAVIFAALRSRGHSKVAEALRISESTFSEWMQKHGDRVAQLLTAVDLKVVPANAECYTDEHIRSLTYFARIGMSPTREDGTRIGMAAELEPVAGDDGGGPRE